MSSIHPPNQWIISRQWDLVFFIGTPLISLAVLLFASNYFSSADIALFVLAFFAVGHHLPGLMRAYGERELFVRYKARFIVCLLYTSPSPRDDPLSRMPSSA